MTPCEKLGYKVGDEFVFSPKDGHHGFRDGEIVELIKDDNSVAPWFKCDDRQHCAWLRDVKPITTDQEQPMTNLITRTNGDPFATEANAKGARTRLGLTHTHDVIQHGGGWALREKQSEQNQGDAAVTLQPGDYIATKDLTEDDYHAVARAFMAAGADAGEYNEDGSEIKSWSIFGWFDGNHEIVKKGLAHWDNEWRFSGRQFTLPQILNATNAGVKAQEETTTEEQQPMPQQHLADQLEAALVALADAQSEVDRLQAEYRVAYPKIHGEVVPSEDIQGWEDWKIGDVMKVVSIDERDPVNVGDTVTIDEDGSTVPYCITRDGRRYAFKHTQLRFVRRP